MFQIIRILKKSSMSFQMVCYLSRSKYIWGGGGGGGGDKNIIVTVVGEENTKGVSNPPKQKKL